MLRKFECWNCKNHFEADDKEWVECPHCHSDNVEYTTIHTPKWIYYVITIVIVLGAALYCIIVNSAGKKVKKEEPINDIEKSDIISQEADSAYIGEGNTIEPSISIDEIAYNEEDNTYTCRFHVAYPPKNAWKIVVMSYYGEKEIATSDDGVFEGLPYSKDDGTYRVKLVDASSGELLCEERDFPDFGKQVLIKKPWSAADLQKAINNKASLVDNPYIDAHHEVVVTNKPKGDTSETSSLAQVQDLLQMCGLTAKVISVEHNDMNQISVAKISINYPTDWITEDDEW